MMEMFLNVDFLKDMYLGGEEIQSRKVLSYPHMLYF